MSNFNCGKCGVALIDSPEGYITHCPHYPKEEWVSDCCGSKLSLNTVPFMDQPYRCGHCKKACNVKQLHDTKIVKI